MPKSKLTKLKDRPDLTPDGRRVLGVRRSSGNPWSDEDARVIAELVGFVPAVPFPGAHFPWAGVCAAGHAAGPRLSDLRKGQGCCNICGNAGRTARSKEKVLAEAKSRGVDVIQFIEPTGKKESLRVVIDFHCARTHDPQPMRANDFLQSQGCGPCANQVLLVGFNDMATTNPELANELLPPLDGTCFVAGTHATLRWKCGGCGNVWSARGNKRLSSGSGCPDCAESGYSKANPGALYVMYGNVKGIPVIKCGISNTVRRRGGATGIPLRGRLRRHEKQGLTEVRYLLDCEDGKVAAELEKKWKAELKPGGLFAGLSAGVPKVLLKDGHTEAVVDAPEVRVWFDEWLGWAQPLTNWP